MESVLEVQVAERLDVSSAHLFASHSVFRLPRHCLDLDIDLAFSAARMWIYLEAAVIPCVRVLPETFIVLATGQGISHRSTAGCENQQALVTYQCIEQAPTQQRTTAYSLM